MLKIFKNRTSRLRFIARIRLKLKMMLSLDVSPRVLAKSSALGALIGISPYVGTQTYIALFVSSYFNLPVYPLMIGVYITNPVTIPFIFAFTTKVGLILLGMDSTFTFDWNNVTLSSLFEAGKTLFIHFIPCSYKIYNKICQYCTNYTYKMSSYNKRYKKSFTCFKK